MEEKIIFKNKTEVTNETLKSMMFFYKVFYRKYITILKSAICIFIICSAIIVNMHEIDKIFCFSMAILGLIDTFKVEQVKLKNKTTLKYEFFDKCFCVNNCETLIEVPYEYVERIIDTKYYYYLVVQKSLMVIAKDGFTLGNEEEIKKFIKCKIK